MGESEKMKEIRELNEKRRVEHLAEMAQEEIREMAMVVASALVDCAKKNRQAIIDKALAIVEIAEKQNGA
jgi:hypothetical protein